MDDYNENDIEINIPGCHDYNACLNKHYFDYDICKINMNYLIKIK